MGNDEVYVRELTIGETTYFYLFHTRTIQGQHKKYKKYIGTTPPDENHRQHLCDEFLETIKSGTQTSTDDHDHNVIAILQDIQQEKQYISKEDIVKLSKEWDIPAVDLYGVATFYTQFKLTPPGKHTISICNGTACHVKSAPRLISHAEKLLGIKAGEVTDDGKIGLSSVNCIGACARAPAMMVDDKVYGELTPEKINKIIKELQESQQ